MPNLAPDGRATARTDRYMYRAAPVGNGLYALEMRLVTDEEIGSWRKAGEKGGQETIEAEAALLNSIREARYEYRVRDRAPFGGVTTWALERRYISAQAFAYPWAQHSVYRDLDRAQADAHDMNREQRGD